MGPGEPPLDDAVLLTIDVQRDVLDGGSLPVPGTSEVVAPIAELCRAFRAARRPIVHVVRLYRADGSDAEPHRRALVRGAVPVLRPGTPGRELAPGVALRAAPALDDEALLAGAVQPLGPGEAAMYKPRWGAFYRTPLDDHLQALGVGTVVIAGCNFPNCPRATIYEASERDHRVVAADGAISGLYDRGRAELRAIGVEVAAVSTLVARVARARRHDDEGAFDGR